jgi:Type IV secretion-system coupling protein DNA-binding domain
MYEFYLQLNVYTKIVIAILQLIFLYHFLIFYILKSVYKKFLFWQLNIYIVFCLGGFIGLQKFAPEIFKDYFLNPWALKVFNYFLSPLINHSYYLIPITVFFFFFKSFYVHKLFPEKKFKHGANFTPTKSKDGIYIGDYNLKVLPSHIRHFSRRFSNKLFLPLNRLSRGITIIGDMGSGKSRLMQILEEDIRKKYPNAPILIHDPKGEWLRTLYNPETDLIFAPHDKRSANWDILHDFKENPEMRHSIISTAIESHHTGSNSDRFWTDSAVSLIKEAFSYDTLDAIKKYLIHKKNMSEDDKTFLSVFASAKIGVKDIVSVQLMNKDKKPKSIIDFINHKGRIFLLNNPACASEQEGALTLFLSAFMLKAISMPDVDENSLRAAIIVDEALTFHLPAEVERAIYSQSRSKGLCIIASAQRLPNKQYNERGMWADQANHILAMRISDLNTRTLFSQRIGHILYDEKQHSVSVGNKNTSTTDSSVEKKHNILAPEDYGTLKNREFILFHENGVAPGIVRDINTKQNNDIKPIDYIPRTDLIEFMKEL